MKNIILAEYITSESTETITLKKSRLLAGICACALPFLVKTAYATTFDWTTANTNVVRDASSFSLTVDGITATAEAYVAEWNGSSYDIFDAFPDNRGILLTAHENKIRVVELAEVIKKALGK